MGRRLKFDMPGPDWRRELGDFRETPREAFFGTPSGCLLVVEVGFGRGEFLVQQAQAHPDHVFLGIEVSWKRCLKLARRLARTEIANVRLLADPAEEVLGDGLREGEVETFWVNFPDPWPKARHARRRFVRPDTIARVARCLRPAGLLHAATDDPDYATQIHEVLAGEASLKNVHATAWVDEVPGRTPTAYELEWRAEGRRMHYFSYCRREASA